MESRVVQPDAVTLSISNGDTLLVKKRLNAGEHKQMTKRGRLDGIEAGTATILAYLLDWSLKGPDGKGLKILDQPPSLVEAAIDSIDVDDYNEVLRAIEAHAVAMQKARDLEKNNRDGAKTSSVISPSPDGFTGDTSGSASSTTTSTAS
jgi:hypothetical protein